MFEVVIEVGGWCMLHGSRATVLCCSVVGVPFVQMKTKNEPCCGET